MCEKDKLMEMKLACNVDLQKEKKLCAELHKITCEMYVLQKKMGDLTNRKVFILQQLQTKKILPFHIPSSTSGNSIFAKTLEGLSETFL